MKQKYALPRLGLFLLLLFALLGFLVKSEAGILAEFDAAITGIIRDNLYPGFNAFFTTVTRFGGSFFVIVLTIIISGIFFVRKKKIEAVWLPGGIIATGIFVQALKLFFNRPRPDLPHLVSTTSMSFPSGHSSAAFVLYGTLIILIGIYVKNKMRAVIAQTLLAAAIFCIGLSRVYSGVHFPSDVIGSFLIGGSWLSLTYGIYSRKRMR
ncbi:MAG: phosphatase PAP2 family protein [Treponema sp.]|nr:phosphatase PAP2 family protein [Treponema sp.]